MCSRICDAILASVVAFGTAGSVRPPAKEDGPSRSILTRVKLIVPSLTPTLVNHADEPLDTILVLEPLAFVQTAEPLLGYLFRGRCIGRRLQVEGNDLFQSFEFIHAYIHSRGEEDDANDARFGNFDFVRTLRCNVCRQGARYALPERDGQIFPKNGAETAFEYCNHVPPPILHPIFVDLAFDDAAAVRLDRRALTRYLVLPCLAPRCIAVCMLPCEKHTIPEAIHHKR